MRVYLAGHTGMVGSAILRKLMADDTQHIITATRRELDLTNQGAVRDFMQARRPDMVILAAAKVGGIMANNSYPADFVHDNLMIATNVIHQAHAAGVDRLLQLGSSCIYTRDAAQPITEAALLTGALEPTNEAYAIAKIAAIKLCESYNRQHGRDYRSLMPTNLYGPGDNFHPNHAHVLPALLQRFDTAVATRAKTVTLWGTGTPRREFLHVDDLAEAALFIAARDHATFRLVTQPMQSHVNVGTGVDIPILELAQMIAKVTGFTGAILTDPTKPDGTPRKQLDVSLIAKLGWWAKIELAEGIRDTYAWYRAQLEAGQHLRTS